MLYFGTGTLDFSFPGVFYAVEAQTGAEQWRFELPDGVTSRPVVADGSVYFGGRDGQLYALNTQTGQLLWQFKTGNAIQTTPIALNEILYTGSNDGNLYTLETQTGQEIWRLEGGGHQIVGLHGNIIYTSDGDYLYAINRQTQFEVWRFKTQGSLFNSGVLAQGVIYLGDTAGFVYAVDAQLGRERWRFSTVSLADHWGEFWLDLRALDFSGDFPPELVFAPTVAGDVIYVGAWNNKLYALHTMGEENWGWTAQ
ncbi:MAG: PQQ-binding-like beta-propeller repeat protein [Anaerolineae bacterium]